ncbi:MAG TPA: hypothetical protein DEA22_08815 [Blastocatellia bacterium]|nr:hypothetical protein [Blastocatellia bacterium]
MRTTRKIDYFHLIHAALILAVLNTSFFVTAAAGQRGQGKGVPRSATGTLKINVPTGIVRNDYWLYVNGRLRTSGWRLPRVPQPGLSLIELPDGNWEGWDEQGLAVSSRTLESYLSAGGDRYGIFNSVEYEVAPGSYTVELFALSRKIEAFPFMSSSKTLTVRAGGVTEMYASTPGRFLLSASLAPASTLGSYLCPDGKFNIDLRTDELLARGTAIRDNKMRLLILRASAAYRAGDSTTTLPLASGRREVDGEQIRWIINSIPGAPYSLEEVGFCRKVLPEYASVFDEFEATVRQIMSDRAQLLKFADDLGSAKAP